MSCRGDVVAAFEIAERQDKAGYAVCGYHAGLCLPSLVLGGCLGSALHYPRTTKISTSSIYRFQFAFTTHQPKKIDLIINNRPESQIRSTWAPRRYYAISTEHGSDSFRQVLGYGINNQDFIH